MRVLIHHHHGRQAASPEASHRLQRKALVRGGKKILEALTDTLKIQPGETTPDRNFSLETVRCLGACGLAPVMVVDEDTHRQMKPSKISGVLEAYDK